MADQANDRPISARNNAMYYLQDKCIPNMFQGILASLMLEKPDNYLSFIDDKLEQIKNRGVDNVNWETFIYHKHPYRDPGRLAILGGKEMSAKSDQRNGIEVDENTKPQVFYLTEPDGEEE